MKKITLGSGKAMVHVFTVFKEGVTTQGPVKILREVDDVTYNVSAKIEFYKSLGYTVTTI
jgi:hypothetical protein